jgi:uncharacterized protein YndB with AHSA1/START domain/uncharacterized glyoxalase superfamily protein PhnB
MSDAGAMKVTTPTDREIVVTRVVNAPRRLVFEAWTNPEYVPQWMLGPPGWSMPVCEIDLRPGGEWHFVWRRSDGTEMEMRGVYKEIAPPERLVSTESWGGDWPETLNTVMFSETDGKTTITMRLLYPSEAARDAALRTGMTDGLSPTFDRLAELLASISARGDSQAGFQTMVTATLSVRNWARAIEFYKAAFNASELYRVEGGGVAQLSVSGAEFWVAEESPEYLNFSPESLGGCSVRMLLIVEDPRAVFAQAVGAGATEVAPVADAYGWRLGRIVDPFGHHWEIGKALS